MNLQQAFDRLFKAAEKALDADLDLPEKEANDAQNELWSALREVKEFYTDELPEWLRS